jgi:predicted nucleic acid-binding Zn ribbon protein
VYRVIHPVGIVFKGKGFYITDNRGDRSALLPKNGHDKDKSQEEDTSGVAKAEDSATSKATSSTTETKAE